MPRRDQVFATTGERLSDFRFNREVATVFDDMVGRSVPFYDEENRKLLLDAGFTHVEEMFRWYNFSTSIAIK